MFRRLGNKKEIASKIYPLFLYHKIYYEPFFGVGGLFFKKPRAQYSLLNDKNKEVFNLFMVIKERENELIDALKITPLDESLFKHWTINEELDPVYQALRFLYITNFSYLSKQYTFRLLHSDSTYKHKLERMIKYASLVLKNTVIRNCEAVDFVGSFQMSDDHIPANKRFIYADPPYINTENNYQCGVWKEEQLHDLIVAMVKTEIPFAISEFKGPVIESIAREHNLAVIDIKDRHNMASPRTEVLLVNYDLPVKNEYK